MVAIDPTAVRDLLEAVIAAFSVLGGGMAYFSGSYAAAALGEGRSAEIVAKRVNEGIGQGFTVSSQASVVTLIIMVWT